TKLCAEKLVTQSNSYSGQDGTRFSSVRYGNVVGSRGSVIPLFREQRQRGRITITDPRMTRFWLTLEQAVHFVIRCIDQMQGGEIFIPKIPSMNIMDLAKAIAPECEIEPIGIRPGEKLHEVLVSEDEARQTIALEGMYIVQPTYPWWSMQSLPEARPVPEDFRYASDNNPEWLSVEALQQLIGTA
nr:polysaccharide biosynthesis protein [Ardenticatenales bacterium]